MRLFIALLTLIVMIPTLAQDKKQAETEVQNKIEDTVDTVPLWQGKTTEEKKIALSLNYLSKKISTGAGLRHDSTRYVVPYVLAGLAFISSDQPCYENDIKSCYAIIKKHTLDLTPVNMICTLQSWIASFSIIFLSEYVQHVPEDKEAKDFLQKVIENLISLQRESGGWGHDKGKTFGYDEFTFPTIYAVFALGVADKAGANVDPLVIKNGLTYIKNAVSYLKTTKGKKTNLATIGYRAPPVENEGGNSMRNLSALAAYYATYKNKKATITFPTNDLKTYLKHMEKKHRDIKYVIPLYAFPLSCYANKKRSKTYFNAYYKYFSALIDKNRREDGTFETLKKEDLTWTTSPDIETSLYVLFMLKFDNLNVFK